MATTATMPSPRRSTPTSRPSSSSATSTFNTSRLSHDVMAHSSSSSHSRIAGTEEGEEDDEEPLEQIVYTSSAYTRDVPPGEVEQILTASRRNNERDGITGLLLYRDGSFVQFLEGPRSRVRACYQRIARDSRHRGLVEIYRAASESSDEEAAADEDTPRLKGRGKRDFKQWSMAYRPVGATPMQELPNAIDSPAALKAARAIAADKQRAVAVAASGAETQEDMQKAEDSFSELLMYSNRKVELPADMSKRMRTLVTTFVKLLNRPL